MFVRVAVAALGLILTDLRAARAFGVEDLGADTVRDLGTNLLKQGGGMARTFAESVDILAMLDRMQVRIDRGQAPPDAIGYELTFSGLDVLGGKYIKIAAGALPIRQFFRELSVAMMNTASSKLIDEFSSAYLSTDPPLDQQLRMGQLWREISQENFLNGNLLGTGGDNECTVHADLDSWQTSFAQRVLNSRTEGITCHMTLAGQGSDEVSYHLNCSAMGATPWIGGPSGGMMSFVQNVRISRQSDTITVEIVSGPSRTVSKYAQCR